MNNILKIRPNIRSRRFVFSGGGVSLRANKEVTYDNIIRLIKELNEILNYFQNKDIIDGALVTVKYDSLVPKSRRIQRIFNSTKKHSNDKIVGARFTDGPNIKHLITYYLKFEELKDSINLLINVARVVSDKFGGVVNNDNLKKELNFQFYELTKTSFRETIVDLSSILKFKVIEYEFDNINSSVITLFKTDENVKETLNKLDINVYNYNLLDSNTILLNKEEVEKILRKAPYLIQMAVKDLSELKLADFKKIDDELISIKDPTNEPTIGVIDTMFDSRVYFSKWVEFKNMLSDEIVLDQKDYSHGTAISSIIVDGPRLNPNLDDGCGNFKVRHFGVASHRNFSSFSIIKNIVEIVKSNKDIKVWNLSLGSNDEINENFISIEASILDKLQHENDCIFVVSATNKPRDVKGDYKIGAPADSINSLVVTSIDENNEKVDYARRGPALNFFIKPDLGYYGNNIKIAESLGKFSVSGTSYAAPWISRKLSYLIDVLGFSKEEAKALIIDSSIKFEDDKKINEMTYIGRGIVPIHINDIIKTKKDEIRFIISGNASDYDTYFNNLPIPMVKDEYPYKVKGTLCYFPKTDRNQGVDYTETELDFQFGRIKNDGNIEPINRNFQSYEGFYIDEQTARENFRKWDNVKHIKDRFTKRPRNIKSYDSKSWGFSLKRKKRTNHDEDLNIRFGLVITLKEIKGVNRIDDFIQQCLLRGIAINEVDVENIWEIYEKAEEEIKFD